MVELQSKADAAPSDAIAFEDGEFAQLVEFYWPQAWITMLSIVCVIGVWRAISHLPNAPSWWP